MDENRTNGEERSEPTQGNQTWLVGLLIALLAAAGIGFGYGYSQHRAMDQLASRNQQLDATMGQLSSRNQDLSATVDQMRGQMNALNAKLADLSKPQPPVATGARSAEARRRIPVRRRVDPAMRQLQAKVSDQQKQLSQMQDEVAKNRNDLETELGSTRDDLNGSIAKNHDELVALERQGQRNYFEFDLSKSKQFQRVGPVLLSLRTADRKHDHYNMVLLVDDKEITKKNVDLYEPVWIYRNDDPAPLQVVVNQIDKNYVHGYVSAPKFTKAELTAAESQNNSAPAVAPAVQTGPGSPNPQPKPPQHPQ
jgi:cell division protein FtsB